MSGGVTSNRARTKFAIQQLQDGHTWIEELSTQDAANRHQRSLGAYACRLGVRCETRTLLAVDPTIGVVTYVVRSRFVPRQGTS